MNYKVSFCIVCMGRLSHLKKTLLKSIENNLDFFPNVEFVLLDYHSQDGLEAWVKTEMRTYIDQGILIYYKTTEPAYFHRSHSRNMAFKQATGDILVNLDADNYAGPGFAAFVNERFQQEDDIYLIPDRFRKNNGGSFGKICVRKTDFMKIRGYDEHISGWGYEDTDLFYRLKQLGIKERKILDPQFLRHINHTNLERIENQKNFDLIDAIYIRLEDKLSEAILLYKDATVERGTIINENESTVLYTGNPASTLLEPEWITGTWISNVGGLDLHYINSMPRQEKFTMVQGGAMIRSTQGPNKVFAKVTSDELINLSLMLNESTKNFIRFKANIDQGVVAVNPESFGEGEVSRNFEEDHQTKQISILI